LYSRKTLNMALRYNYLTSGNPDWLSVTTILFPEALNMAFR
jgi:hypothetical protein